MTLAGQHPDEATDGLVVVEVAHGAELAAHQRPGGVDLVVGVHLVHGLPDELVVDPLAAQLLRQGTTREAFAGLTLRHPLAGEGGVIDQADLLEPVEEAAGDVVGDVARAELGGQLGAGPGTTGQLVEQDLAGHRLRVGLGARIEVLARLRGPA